MYRIYVKRRFNTTQKIFSCLILLLLLILFIYFFVIIMAIFFILMLISIGTFYWRLRKLKKSATLNPFESPFTQMKSKNKPQSQYPEDPNAIIIEEKGREIK